MKKVIINNPAYEIKKAKIIRTKKLTETEKLFEVALLNGESLDHEPGQFVEVSLFGAGEAPISLASSPTVRDSFSLCVRAVGRFTSAMHRLETGDEVGIRGPFGKGFPIRLLQGNDLVLIAGGLGIAPLRSLINYVLDNRRDFGKVVILLGCKSPESILFFDEINDWEKRIDVQFNTTVERCFADWTGNVGLITEMIPGLDIIPDRTYSIVVGPPVMYKFVIKELLAKKIPESQIHVSLERHMKCGLGKCGHCQIHSIYCCQDGPVFRYDFIKNIKGAI